MATAKQSLLLSSLMGSLLLAGCSLAPEYQPAKVIVTVKFKESDPKLEDSNWKIAQPADAAKAAARERLSKIQLDQQRCVDRLVAEQEINFVVVVSISFASSLFIFIDVW